MAQSPLMVSDNLLSCFAYGVGHGADGVCLLIQIGSYRILLDCGLSDIQPLEVTSVNNQPPVDAVFVTHAHGDHAQGLLSLHQSFPQLPIYGSEVTVKLLPLNWEDRPIATFCQGLKWRSPLKLAENLTAELFPAGHLPGAAAILLSYKTPQKTYKVFYTGDFCLSNLQLVEGLSLDSLRGLAPDVLIIEGSYGTSRHSHRRQQEKQLMERIEEALIRGQNVLLPVPTLGLGQEILKLLRSHHQFTGRNLDIWVDGTVALACDLYLELLPNFPASVQNFAKHQPLFWDERVCPRMRRLTPQAKEDLAQTPCIFIVDDKAELQEYYHLGDRSWLILVPEHPGVSLTPEAGLLSIPNDSLRLKLETYLLAEHSDVRNTTQLIHNLRPQHLMFVHGAPAYLADLTSLEELQNRYQLHSPAPGTLVELPVGDNFIQPATAPQSCYEGELNEFVSFITITLPDAITCDPRWNNFADTGIVEARWQGEELLLRGVSQRELLSQTNDSKRLVEVDCCSNCWHYRGGRCWNQASPLYGFKVTPEGYCPVFEPFTSEE